MAALEALVRGASADHVRTVTPLRAVRSWLRFREVSGTDDTLVELEPETDAHISRVVITVGNANPRRIFQRCAAHFGRRNVDIRGAYLDVFPDGGNGFVNMLSFLVQSPERTALDPNSAFWRDLSGELARIKWLSDAAFELAGEIASIGLIRAEIIVGLASLAHQVLITRNPHGFTHERLLRVSKRYHGLSTAIADLLVERSSPTAPLSDETFAARYQAIDDRIDREVDREDARTMLDTMLQVVKATYKTNLHRPQRYGFALRLDPQLLARPDHAELPYGVFFVHARGFDGLHVRFRDIARGGVRVVRPHNAEQLTHESDRLFDEVYNLASAQQMKNKDIPEGGAKAVIVAAPEISTSRAVKGFVDGLLDLIVTEPSTQRQVLDRFGKPEVIYLGPDENITPEHIEWIVARARKRGYGLPSAFMSSKPGAGINHKEYGVTSEGVTVFLDVALRTVGIDPSRQNFTVKLTGGPDGDVAGNEIKILHRDYGERAQIVGIADGSGSAEDPDGLSHAELLRLVERSAPIAEFDRKHLGPKGRVVSVTEPDGVKLRNTLHNRVVADAFIPAGGRPKTIHEANWQEYLLADGKPSSRVIIEGANIFITPAARQRLGEAGVLIVKDSSANKCGVICSSYEISACMILDESEFLANKPQFVAEVLDKLRLLARREAELLFREHARNPAVLLPELSTKLSKVLNRTADAITQHLPHLNEDEQALTQQIIRGHLPPVLVALAGERIFTKLPPAYARSIVASALSTDIVYREGLDYLATLPEAELGQFALRYLKQENATRRLVALVEKAPLEEKALLTRILAQAGTRVALETPIA